MGGRNANEALLLASQISGVKQVTLGGDKNYDTQELVRDLREMKVTPHVAQNNTNRRSAIDGRTTQHAGYGISVDRTNAAADQQHLDRYSCLS